MLIINNLWNPTDIFEENIFRISHSRNEIE